MGELSGKEKKQMEKEKGKTLYGAKVDFEEAKKLADYTLIFRDLEFVENVLKRLKQLLENESKDLVLIESLWSAALIAYCRCFAKGRRLGLSEDIFKSNMLKGDPIACHRYYKNQRDKLIAHSVNPFEQVVIDLQLSDRKSREQKVLGLSVLIQKLISLIPKDIEAFLMLSLFAKEEIRKLAKEYKAKTLEVGKKLPIESLYSKARGRIITPGAEDSGKARKK